MMRILTLKGHGRERTLKGRENGSGGVVMRDQGKLLEQRA